MKNKLSVISTIVFWIIYARFSFRIFLPIALGGLLSLCIASTSLIPFFLGIPLFFSGLFDLVHFPLLGASPPPEFPWVVENIFIRLFMKIFNFKMATPILLTITSLIGLSTAFLAIYAYQRIPSVQFKSLYQSLLITTLISDSLDLGITLTGFLYFPVWYEANFFVRYLMAMGIDPRLAIISHFSITLVFLFLAYLSTRCYLRESPYNKTVRDVGLYLCYSSGVKSRDMVIFACIALCIAFIHLHFTGIISWLMAFLE